MGCGGMAMGSGEDDVAGIWFMGVSNLPLLELSGTSIADMVLVWRSLGECFSCMGLLNKTLSKMRRNLFKNQTAFPQTLYTPLLRIRAAAQRRSRPSSRSRTS